jgi:nitrogen fixation protein NifB
MKETPMNGIDDRLANHPCFNPGACAGHARVHLPVAPKCNMGCNYCDRSSGDCVNESRPGVTSAVLKPRQALAYLEAVADRMPVSVAGIAGPGDPLANPDATLETLALVRRRFPEMLLCLSTNGLALPGHAERIAELGVSHVTVTVNAVDPAIGAGLYGWMRDGAFARRGVEAAALLLARQEAGIRALAARGVIVKVNTVDVPGHNDRHVEDIARTAREWGAAVLNPMPMIPVPGARFGGLPEPDVGDMLAVRAAVARHIRVMGHCRRCRADAAGLLGEDIAPETTELLRAAAALPVGAGADRTRVAVTSREGMLVNCHFGEAPAALVYERSPEGGYAFLEKRPLPPPGGGAERWATAARTLSDCSHLLTAGAGEPPIAALGNVGVECLVIEGVIDLALSSLAAGRSLAFMVPRGKRSCDGTGAGGGCGGA